MVIDIWNPGKCGVGGVLEAMADDNPDGMKVIDIEAKYNLHKLHKVAGVNRVISWSTVSSIALVILWTVTYACRNHLVCGKLPFPAITMARSNENPVSFTELETTIEGCDTLFAAPSVLIKSKKTTRNR